MKKKKFIGKSVCVINKLEIDNRIHEYSTCRPIESITIEHRRTREKFQLMNSNEIHIKEHGSIQATL